ncbi:alpha/beta hydrolase [Ectopseudomonas mendocina]|uniref:Alpha/beta hydrolase n=1 Tax=Ectopseudomonas mendocina TaxID=300 RepID=A0ABZ2RPR6_ECTME
MATFSHNGCNLYYEEHGQGAPLLLVHGLGSSTRDWELQIPVLAQYFRVIAFDVRGHGQSSKPRERYSIKGFADDTAALIQHLQLPPVHLVGISMGGMIGFQLAVDHPELLKSLCVINSLPEVRGRNWRDRLEIAKRWILARVLSLDTLAKALGKLLFPKQEQALLRQKMEERWPQNDKRAYLSSLDAIIGWSVRERLGQITCPTLVVAAEHDYSPVSLKQNYVSEMKHAQLLVIEDSRHATPLDQPEHFNRSLLAFLQEVEQTANSADKD